MNQSRVQKKFIRMAHKKARPDCDSQKINSSGHHGRNTQGHNTAQGQREPCIERIHYKKPAHFPSIALSIPLSKAAGVGGQPDI